MTAGVVDWDSRIHLLQVQEALFHCFIGTSHRHCRTRSHQLLPHMLSDKCPRMFFTLNLMEGQEEPTKGTPSTRGVRLQHHHPTLMHAQRHPRGLTLDTGYQALATCLAEVTGASGNKHIIPYSTSPGNQVVGTRQVFYSYRSQQQVYTTPRPSSPNPDTPGYR